MTAADAAATVLLLSEDTDRHCVAILEGLVRALLRFIDPRCRPERLRFEPVGEHARAVVNLHDYAEARPSVDRIRLHRNILETLMSDRGFVVLHVNAERRWSDRAADPSEKVATLQRHVVAHVRAGLEAIFRRQEPELDDAGLRQRIDARMARFFRLVPYWELESWLYQNTDSALALCLANPACRGGHGELLATWSADRGALDELPAPSQHLCFGKHSHRALLDNFPVAAAVAAGKSLAVFVDSLRSNEVLMAALAGTHASADEAEAEIEADIETDIEVD